MHDPSNFLDMESTVKRLGNDEELYTELLAVFFEDLPDRLGDLRQALDEQDLGQIERRAHTIKGSAAAVGAEKVRATALILEQKARETQNPADVVDVASALLEVAEKTLAAVADHLDN